MLLAGEPGIGKTRLARKLAKDAEAEGAGVAWGRCWEGGGAPTFWPWVEAMRGAVATAGLEGLRGDLGEGAHYVVHLFPELRGRFSTPKERSVHPAGDPEHEHADPEHARFLLFDSVTRLLVAAASRKPLLIVLDDLHAADTPSLSLLEYVVRHLEDTRLVIVGTARDAEVRRRPEAADIFSRCARGSSRLTLGGLSEAEVAELVSASAGETVPGDVLREIHRATDGSPLFVQEVMRTLSAQGRLSSPGTKVGELPEGVRDVIRRRLAPLPTHCHDVLSVAAVVGRDFEVGVLEAVSDRPQSQIFEILDEATREGVVEVDGSSRAAGRFRFVHALFRETLYQSLQHGRRLGLHLQVASALEASQGPEPPLSELAHHFFAAAALGSADKAIDYSLRAAATATERLAYEEALVQYERALGLPFADERVRAEALARLAQTHRSLGHWEEALPTWEKALAIYERLGEREAVGRLCWDVGHQLGTAWRWPESFAFVGRGLAALGDIVNADHVRLLTRSGVALSAIGHHHAGKSAIERGLGMAETLGDEALIGYAIYSKAIHHWRYMEVAELIETGGRASAGLLRIGDVDHACNASIMVLGAQILAGELQAAKKTAEELRPYAGKLAQHLSTWMMQAIDSAVLAVETGDLVGAGRDLMGSIASAPRFEGDTYLVAVLSGILASWRGDTEGALGYFEQVARFDKDTVVTDSKSYVVLALAMAGRTDEALAALEEGRHRLARSGQPNAYASWKLSLSAVEVLVLAGKRQEAAALYPTVLEAKIGGARCVGIDFRFIDTVAGMAAAAGRQWSLAEDHYQAALRLASEMPQRIEQAEVRRFYATMLVERDAPGDRENAVELIDEAITMYRKLGMPLHLGIGERLRASLGDPGRPEGTAASATVEVVFREEGDYWTVGYEGRTFHLRSVKGLRYLRELLRNPGRELSVTDLAADPSEEITARAIDGADVRLRSAASALGDAGEVLDARAKSEYAARLRDLRGELEEATRFNDTGRSARLAEEIDALTRELASAVGLGGRDRKAASAAERARQHHPHARRRREEDRREGPRAGRLLREDDQDG